ncbi:MAG: carboxypeptidase-like regulatory domain-containing protein [Candidatus Nitrosotenuis sp.]
MQKMIAFLFIVALSIVMVSGLSVAYAATISGTVKYAGSGLSGAKVTAEGPNSYLTTITSGSGTWSLTTVDGTTYSVDGMKQSFTHARVTGISGSQSGITHNLSTRSTVNAEFKIVGDEEFRSLYGASWKTTAKDKLLSAEPWYKDEHTISFADVAYYDTWDSNDSPPSCNSMVNEAMSETGWSGGTYSGAQVLAVFTAQTIPDANACVNTIPSSGGTHPAFITQHTTSDLPRTIMHEISHLYGFSHAASCTNIIPHIMASSCGSSYVKNWLPGDDDLLDGSRRTWY